MYSNDTSGQQLGAVLASFGLIFGLISIAAVVFAVIIYWKIFSKAGYSGAMSLLMFVPIANLIVLCVLAFGEWPIYRELNQLRQRVNAQYPQNQQSPQYPQNPSYPRQ
jgi:uncharacterized membrane protein YhaH (DUF805 family)